MEETAVTILTESRKKELFRKFLEAIILSLAKDSIALSDLQYSISWLGTLLKISPDVIRESLKFILSGKDKEEEPDGYDEFVEKYIKYYISRNLGKKDGGEGIAPIDDIEEQIKRLVVNTGVEMKQEEIWELIEKEFYKYELKSFWIMVFKK